MGYTFQLREDSITDEEAVRWTVYGVDIVKNNVNSMDGDRIICSVPDIFCDRDDALRFVNMCNEKQVSVYHLYDILDDIL